LRWLQKAIREAIALLPSSAQLVGCIILVDRQERGANSAKSTVMELSEEYGVPVVPIVGLNDIILWMEKKGGAYAEQLEKMKAYRAQWGVTSL
jgi:orotate phosphoribosyltransferase